MATNKIQTGIRFEEETLKKLSYIAKKNHRSFNAHMEHLAEVCIREYEDIHGSIQVEIGKKHLSQ